MAIIRLLMRLARAELTGPGCDTSIWFFYMLTYRKKRKLKKKKGENLYRYREGKEKLGI